MGELAGRAEAIGAHLVGRALGATASRFDAEGRQSVVDFLLEWPNAGRRGALEVTLVTQPESAAWQGMAAKEGWRWPAPSGWEFRLTGPDMPYQRTRRAVLRAVALCYQWSVDGPHQLSADVLHRNPELGLMNEVGDLRRTSLKPGVTLLPEVRAEFVEATSSDFATVEGWLHLPHMPRHVEKIRSAAAVAERHLFLVPVDEVLPARFFTNDFPAPTRSPEGFNGLDGIWVWSNYWHQFLAWRAGTWQWLDFPPNDDNQRLN